MEAFPTSTPVIFVHADEDGGYLAHLPALPGCVARAQTAEAAVAAVRTLAPAYATLLQRAAFPVPDFAAAPVQETFTQVTLPIDQEPLAPAELAAHLRLLAAARQETLARVQGLSPEALAWKPDEKSWCLNDVLHHLAHASGFYLCRLVAWPEDEFARLAAVRQWVVQVFAGFSAADLSHANLVYGIEWTPLGALHSLLEHEAEHKLHIAKLLAAYRAATCAPAPWPELPAQPSPAAYAVYLQPHGDGGFIAFIPALPGCVGRGDSREETLAVLDRSATECLDFLRRHGEAIPPASPQGRQVTELGSWATPDYDLRPFSPADRDVWLRWAARRRQELLDALAQLPALNWQPDEKTWSVRRILSHVAYSEWWLARVTIPQSRDPLLRLAAAQQEALTRLSALTPEELTRTAVHEGEPWTARKVFRRFLEHEREHLGQVEEILGAYRESYKSAALTTGRKRVP
ncbi:MAG: DUF664 domain-containing protein [Chloroflexi bacterium]|nr:DUF664 domain-containing protein [Chloroflexota bacterium]